MVCCPYSVGLPGTTSACIGQWGTCVVRESVRKASCVWHRSYDKTKVSFPVSNCIVWNLKHSLLLGPVKNNRAPSQISVKKINHLNVVNRNHTKEAIIGWHEDKYHKSDGVQSSQKLSDCNIYIAKHTIYTSKETILATKQKNSQIKERVVL